MAENPAYAAITPVIEKEILHHDILAVMVKQGAMQQLTFIGGTSLRMCYNSKTLILMADMILSLLTLMA